MSDEVTYGDGTPVDPGSISVAATAAAAASWFVEERRVSDGSPYVHLRGGCPTWVSETVKQAHGDGTGRMLPDDYRYRWVRDALEAIGHEYGPDSWGPVAGWEDIANEWADADSAMPYNADRVARLGSHASRAGWVDDADVAETGSLFERIGAGIAAERFYVFSVVAREVLYVAESEVVTPTAPAPDCLQATSPSATCEQTTDAEAEGDNRLIASAFNARAPGRRVPARDRARRGTCVRRMAGGASRDTPRLKRRNPPIAGRVCPDTATGH